MGMVYGDVNRYNFVIDEKCDWARLVNFEHATPWEEEKAQEELISLIEELTEEEEGEGSRILI